MATELPNPLDASGKTVAEFQDRIIRILRRRGISGPEELRPRRRSERAAQGMVVVDRQPIDRDQLAELRAAFWEAPERTRLAAAAELPLPPKVR